jgi:biopolymer transport protein ExbD
MKALNFRKNLKLIPSSPSLVIPFIDVMVLAVFLFVLVAGISSKVIFDVRIPRAVTSDIAHEDSIMVVVTGEGIFYLNGRVVTYDELRSFIRRPGNHLRPLLIKADHRASIGRIVEVWDLARSSGVERIEFATDRGFN